MKQNLGGKEEHNLLKTATTIGAPQESDDEDVKANAAQTKKLADALYQASDPSSGKQREPHATKGEDQAAANAIRSRNLVGVSYDRNSGDDSPLGERTLADLEKEAQLRGLGLSSFTGTGTPGAHPASGPGHPASQYHTQGMPDELTASLGPARAPEIASPKRLYMVGKFKEYRKLVGLEQVKSHAGDPDLNMSQKRRKTLSMSVAPPT
jgi:hypothetical protein